MFRKHEKLYKATPSQRDIFFDVEFPERQRQVGDESLLAISHQTP